MSRAIPFPFVPPFYRPPIFRPPPGRRVRPNNLRFTLRRSFPSYSMSYIPPPLPVLSGTRTRHRAFDMAAQIWSDGDDGDDSQGNISQENSSFKEEDGNLNAASYQQQEDENKDVNEGRNQELEQGLTAGDNSQGNIPQENSSFKEEDGNLNAASYQQQEEENKDVNEGRNQELEQGSTAGDNSRGNISQDSIASVPPVDGQAWERIVNIHGSKQQIKNAMEVINAIVSEGPVLPANEGHFYIEEIEYNEEGEKQETYYENHGWENIREVDFEKGGSGEETAHKDSAGTKNEEVEGKKSVKEGKQRECAASASGTKKNDEVSEDKKSVNEEEQKECVESGSGTQKNVEESEDKKSVKEDEQKECVDTGSGTQKNVEGSASRDSNISNT